MRIRYDPEIDALSVVFREATVTTRELADGNVGEYDAEERLVGLEILDAGARFGDPIALHDVTLERIGLAVPQSQCARGAIDDDPQTARSRPPGTVP